MSRSLYHGRRNSAPCDIQWRLTLRAETLGRPLGSHQDEISTGILSPSAEALFADHVVGGRILLPGVGYLEMTFIANLGRYSAFTDVAFIRPCWLPTPKTNERCVLRCTRRDEGAFEIASWRGVGSSGESNFTSHFWATPKNSTNSTDKGTATTSAKFSRRGYFSWNLITNGAVQSSGTPRGIYVVSSHEEKVKRPIRTNSTATRWCASGMS